ncbi:MAG: phage tail protein [Solirubrobacteraceae bacterium]
MSQPFIGEIRIFGGNFAPTGWALCNGQLMAIDEFAALFALIGTTYGGDGQQTFALPNLQGRVPVHQGSGYVMGQLGGVESVTLTVAQIPVHTHVAVASTLTGDQAGPGSHLPAAGAQISRYTTAAPATAMNAGSVGPAGSSQPHENRQPFLAITFIISLFGIFPSQS